MIRLRDMQKTDIIDYVKWFTSDTDWCNNRDTPWDKIESTESDELNSWTDFYHYINGLDDNEFRSKFEIDCDGKHIGWVSCYYDLEYMENPNHILAIGIEIPVKEARGHGYGTKALNLYIDYLKERGNNILFIQTWSGNYPMVKVIEKLGFKEYYRKEKYRKVKNKYYDAITYSLEM